MWIDIHAHCYDFADSELSHAVESAVSRDIHAIVNAATSTTTIKRVCEQAGVHNILYATAGISAFDVEGLEAGWQQHIETALIHEKVVGVGEIGIDNTNPRYPSIELQRPVFEQQLDIARRHDMAAVIHSRGAEKAAIEACKSIGLGKALFHCFTGSKESLAMVLDAGYYVSFSGIITFPKGNLRELVEYAPADRLFIETDTPYLAPVPHRGKPNRPLWVVEVGQKVAEIKGMEPDKLAGQISTNASILFGIPMPVDL